MFDFASATFHGDLVSILIAILVGGLLGVERQSRDKAAGLRTMIFICLGSTCFTIISQRLAPADPVRIAAQVVSGIGFIGAGVILRHGTRVLGVTTAAAIWMAAALGMAIGARYYELVLPATLLAVLILWRFPALTRIIDRFHEEHTYFVVLAEAVDVGHIGELLAGCRLNCQSRSFERENDRVTCKLELAGSAKAHERLVQTLLVDARVAGFHY